MGQDGGIGRGSQTGKTTFLWEREDLRDGKTRTREQIKASGEETGGADT